MYSFLFLAYFLLHFPEDFLTVHLLKCSWYPFQEHLWVASTGPGGRGLSLCGQRPDCLPLLLPAVSHDALPTAPAGSR